MCIMCVCVCVGGWVGVVWVCVCERVCVHVRACACVAVWGCTLSPYHPEHLDGVVHCDPEFAQENYGPTAGLQCEGCTLPGGNCASQLIALYGTESR